MKERNFLQKGIWKTKGRKGFSLGEVLLTVAILAILTATAVPAVGYFSRLLNQMKLDNTAREIFISAQNKMVTMKSCGMELPEGESMGVTSPTDYDTGAWLNKGADDTIHPFRFVSSENATFMQDTLLAKDKQEGEYVIEYNRNTGNVYAVFYWEPQEVDFGGKSSFTYAEKNNEPGVRGDRKARMDSGLKVGYYGGNVAAMTEAEELVYDAKIINEDKLQLWLMAEDETIGKDTRYVITLRSATDTTNTAEYTFGVQYKDGFAKSVTFDGTATEASLKNNVEVLKDVTKKEHGFLITLDSVEANQHFANLFPKIAAGDDISIKVQAYYLGTDKVCIAKRNYEMTQNSLFARVRQEATSGGATSGGAIKRNPQGTDVVITTGRHLQNLSVEASHLGYTSKGTEKKTKHPIVNAKLNANIDWQKKVDEKENYYENNNTLYSKDTLLKSFQPIRIDEKSDLKKIEGNERSISHLQITKGSGTGAGLFGVVSKELTIENLKMKDCVVNTENVGNVGMLIGQVNAQAAKQVMITGCGTYLSPDKEPYNEKEHHVKNAGASVAIGGFVGGLKNGTLTIQDSFSAVNIGGNDTASVNVGGFVGLADGGSLTMNNSYTSCVVDAEGKTGAYAGGLAGQVTAALTARNCFTTCDVSAKADANSYSGGAFGYLSNGTLNDILSYGRVTWKGGTTEHEKDFSGGFVGKNEGSVAFPDCYYLSMKEYNVTGNDIATWKSHKELRLKTVPTYQKGLTHAYNADLKTKEFPFPLMKKADGKELLPYYGNWSADLGDRESVLGLCYYEKYDDDTYSVFISGMNMYDTNKPVYVDMLDYEPTSKKRVQNFGYCIAAKNVVTKYTKSALPLKAEDYTFYDLPMESIKNFEKGTRKIELKGHLKGKPETESLTKDFYYHPDFAAAISMGGLTNGKYASALESYQVRCMTQLKKVEDNKYENYAFSQTANFSTGALKSDSVVAFLPTGASYDGRAKHLNSELPSQAYTIDVRITQKNTTTGTEGKRVVGLFGTNKGTLKNVNVTGGIEIYYLSADGFQAGALTGRNEGRVEKCVSQTSLVFKTPGTGALGVGAARIGGLIGENAANASCILSRVENADLLSAGSLKNKTNIEVYIGGLIGLSAGTCEFNQVRDSTILCKNTEEETVVTRNLFVGGFVGGTESGITGCQAIDVTICNGTTFDTSLIEAKPTIGGFAGKISANGENEKISYCAYYGDIYLPRLILDYNEAGQFVGKLDKISRFESCYGWSGNDDAPYYFKGSWGTDYPYKNCYCYKSKKLPVIPVHVGLTYTDSMNRVQRGLSAPDGWKWEKKGEALVLMPTS
nr:prepilin-type N-terminal cleavage/methylation domain-containing protein [uncultured Anaerotignum sp.]